jgi:hypothetical protein
MLGDFQNQFILDPLHFKCVENFRQIAFELNINHSTNDLRNLPDSQVSTAEASYKISVRISALNHVSSGSPAYEPLLASLGNMRGRSDRVS